MNPMKHLELNKNVSVTILYLLNFSLTQKAYYIFVVLSEGVNNLWVYTLVVA